LVVVEKDKVENIPLLHVVKESEKLEKLPLVIFIHGFQSVKERNLHYAYLLAEAGFRVVLPEVLYHGEREQGLSEKEFYARFWEMVLNTIAEIKMLKESYLKKGLIDSEKIGLAGTSMGGIVTLGALTQFRWIKAAVSLMGIPSYEEFSLWQLEQLKSQGITLPFTEEQFGNMILMIGPKNLITGLYYSGTEKGIRLYLIR
jgi:dienelactone hydrolase